MINNKKCTKKPSNPHGTSPKRPAAHPKKKHEKTRRPGIGPQGPKGHGEMGPAAKPPFKPARPGGMRV